MRRDSVVIMVGDEPTRDLCACWMKDSGAAVTVLDDCDDVSGAISGADAGVFVTDRLYRIGAGQETIQELRQRFPGLKLVVVPLRSYLEGDMERLAWVVGADAVLSGPLTRKAVARVLS
jgi:DNA-binding NtrC family response regulator